MIGQAHACAVGRLDENPCVEAQRSVIALDFDIGIAKCRVERQIRLQLAREAVDGWTETNRYLFVEGIADRWLYGDNLDYALAAEPAALEAAFIVGNQTERSIDTDTRAPLIVDLIGVKA